MPVILFEVSVLYFYSLVVQFTFFKKQFQGLDLQPTPLPSYLTFPSLFSGFIFLYCLLVFLMGFEKGEEVTVCV